MIVLVMIIVQSLALWVIIIKTVFAIIFFWENVKEKAKSNKKMCHMKGHKEKMCLVK